MAGLSPRVTRLSAVPYKQAGRKRPDFSRLPRCRQNVFESRPAFRSASFGGRLTKYSTNMLAWKSMSLCCLFAQMLSFPHRRNRSVEAGVGFRGDLPRIAAL
jgi:hypothetical protein